MTAFEKASFGLDMLPAATSPCFLIFIVYGHLPLTKKQT